MKKILLLKIILTRNQTTERMCRLTRHLFQQRSYVVNIENNFFNYDSLWIDFIHWFHRMNQYQLNMNNQLSMQKSIHYLIYSLLHLIFDHLLRYENKISLLTIWNKAMYSLVRLAVSQGSIPLNLWLECAPVDRLCHDDFLDHYRK